MKVTIQTLKAPWPTGAKVGDVVAFEGDTAPAWAVGKFTPAPDNAKADFHYEPRVAVGDGSGLALTPFEGELTRFSSATACEQERQEREAIIRQQLDDMQAERDQAVQQRDAAQADLAAALDREAALQQQLTAAQAQAGPAGKTREDLNADAEKLGIKVDGRWSDERLTDEIAKAAKK